MVKTLRFGVMHMSIAFGVAWGMTCSIWIGGAIALVEPMVNTVGYVVHEHLWSRRTAHGAVAGAHQPA